MVHRGVAQLVEYWSPKPWVVGSSPSAPAKKFDKLRLVEFFYPLRKQWYIIRHKSVYHHALEGVYLISRRLYLLSQ